MHIVRACLLYPLKLYIFNQAQQNFIVFFLFVRVYAYLGLACSYLQVIYN